MDNYSNGRQKRSIRLAYKVSTPLSTPSGRTGQQSITMLPLHKLLGRPVSCFDIRRWRPIRKCANSVLWRSRDRASVTGAKW